MALVGSWGAQGTPGVAYTAAGSELYRLELATGELTSLGDLGFAGIEAMALDPSGVLYAANSLELYTVDLTVPALNTVGPLTFGPFDGPTSMAFDAEGRLWVAASGKLYEVDPLTGTASARSGDIALLALAEGNGELYGILDGPGPPPGPDPPPPPPIPDASVALIDRQTGGFQLLAPIVGLVRVSNAASTVVYDLDFDLQGRAWLLQVESLIIAPPIAFHRIYQATDLETGIVELVSERQDDVSLLMRTWALLPDRGVVAIPTLSSNGLALLCAALIAGALWTIRRHTPTL